MRFIAVLFLALAASASNANDQGIIVDPDGYSNLRSEPDAKSAIVEKLFSGEFVRVREKKGDWYFVRTELENDGYLHKSRLHFLQGGLPAGEWQNNEIRESGLAAARLGINYPVTLKYAREGRQGAIRLLFWMALRGEFDGGAGECLSGDLWELGKLLGDSEFAEILARESVETRNRVLDQLSASGDLDEFPSVAKLRS